jgi:hypothetical protein
VSAQSHNLHQLYSYALPMQIIGSHIKLSSGLRQVPHTGTGGPQISASDRPFQRYLVSLGQIEGFLRQGGGSVQITLPTPKSGCTDENGTTELRLTRGNQFQRPVIQSESFLKKPSVSLKIAQAP